MKYVKILAEEFNFLKDQSGLYEVLSSNGCKEYYKDGKLHRPGEPAVIYANGVRKYYKDGKIHRLDGPAVISSNGHKAYYKEGKLHRLTGPAVIRLDGSICYYLNNKLVKKEELIKILSIEQVKRFLLNPENF